MITFSRLRGALPALALALLLPSVTPRSAVAQGWIEPLPGRPIPVVAWAVEKTRSQVSVTVEGRVAKVVLTEWFRNHGNLVAVGEYLYPLPGEAAFSGFSIWQGEQELRGEMMDRTARARSTRRSCAGGPTLRSSNWRATGSCGRAMSSSCLWTGRG